MSHWDLIDERCYRVVAAAIHTLARQQADYVLGGGWAVYAHVPSTPSVDTDIYVSGPADPDVTEPLQAAGFRVGMGQEIEFLDRHERYGFWAFGDEDLGIALPGFAVAEVLDHNVVRGTLSLPDGPIPVAVPTPGALALLKCCAMANRDLAYRSFHEGRAGMLIGPGRIPQIRAQSQSYYLRKAGKDLFDLSLLVVIDGARERLWQLATRHGLQGILPKLTTELDQAVTATAEEMANRVAMPAPLDVARDALAAPP